MTRKWSCPLCGSDRVHCYDNQQYPEDHLLICFQCGVASQGQYHPRFNRRTPIWNEHTPLDQYDLILESEVGDEEGVLRFSNVMKRLGLDSDDFGSDE